VRTRARSAEDGGIDHFRAQRPQPSERAVLVRARHPTEADDVGSQDRSDLAGFGHRGHHTRCTITQRLTSPEWLLWVDSG
jgi:hypothetical protein